MSEASIPGNYFTAGHSLFTFHVSYEDFLRSLYYNLLLSPNGVSFVDHFFISEYFQKEILERGPLRSWIAAGLENGLIRTFVKSGFSGFSSQLANQKKYGARGLPRHSDRLARELDNIPMADPTIIQRNYGEAFNARLSSVLSSDTTAFTSGFSGDHATDLVDFWESRLIKTLRTEGYGRAKEITEESGTSGLRLATLIESARQITTGRGADVHDSVGKLLIDLGNDKERAWQVKPVQRFFKIACDTFNVAMADCIGVAPNSPKLDYDFVAIQGFYKGEGEKPENQIVIHENAKMPDIRVLLAANAQTMLDCREKGEPFFEAFAIWQARQDSESAGYLIEKLRDYCEVICQCFESPSDTDEFSLVVATDKSAKGVVRDNAVAIGSGTTAGLVLEVAGVTGASIVGVTAGILGSAVLGQIKSIVISNRLSELAKARSIRQSTDIRLSLSGDVGAH